MEVDIVTRALTRLRAALGDFAGQDVDLQALKLQTEVSPGLDIFGATKWAELVATEDTGNNISTLQSTADASGKDILYCLISSDHAAGANRIVRFTVHEVSSGRRAVISPSVTINADHTTIERPIMVPDGWRLTVVLDSATGVANALNLATLSIELEPGEYLWHP